LFAALLHDVAKPKMSKWEWKNGRITVTSRGHDTEGVKIAEKFCDRWGIYTLEGYPLRDRILALVRTHHRPGEIYAQREVVTKKAFNRLAKELEGEYLLAILLDVADRNARGQPPLEDLDEPGRWLLNKFKEYKISESALKPIVYGRDLLAIGFKPGPKLGKILKRLYEMQLDGVFETKEEGIKLAEKISMELFGKERV
jgi:tRNA nucleotidyltransferase (CCA-adding enzyme)